MNVEWIPTKERTPKERGKYLCCGPRAVYIAELLDPEKVEWYVNTRFYPPHPVAWMPVPEVYKEDK